MAIKNYQNLKRFIHSSDFRKYLLSDLSEIEDVPLSMTDKLVELYRQTFPHYVVYDAENVYQWNAEMKTHIETLRGLPCYPPYSMMYLEFGEKDIFPTVVLATSMPRESFRSHQLRSLASPHVLGEGTFIMLDIFQGVSEKAPFFLPMGKGGVVLDKNGRIDSPAEPEYVPYSVRLPKEVEEAATQEQRDGIIQTLVEAVFATLLTYALTHMKNTKTVDNEEKLSRQQRRWRERTRNPPIVYKTIEVRPFRNLTPREASEVTRKGVREHWVAGHIARYGEEFGTGKLFGKHEGVYFIPPHLRGDSDYGSVEKDYVIAGKETE